MCNSFSFVSWTRTRPHFTNRQAGTSSELPVDAPNFSMFSSPLWPRADQAECVKWWDLNPQQTQPCCKEQPGSNTSDKRISNKKRKRKTCAAEYKGMLLTRCSVYLDSCCVQSQMHINLQFNISSNPGRKKETNSCMFITQNHRNVPSEFFLIKQRSILAPSWYPWNPRIMLQWLCYTRKVTIGSYCEDLSLNSCSGSHKHQELRLPSWQNPELKFQDLYFC